jgi:ribosomal protein S18 acetylase RimI-like enzyme
MAETIIEAAIDQVPRLVASAAALFAEDGGTWDATMDVGWPDREGTTYYAELVRDPAALCLLACSADDPGTVLGHLIGRLRQNDPLRPGLTSATLESMRVDSGHRRGGIGSALVRAFSVWADKNGASRVRVTAYSGNTAAVAFYHSHGFAAFETTLCATALPTADTR